VVAGLAQGLGRVTANVARAPGDQDGAPVSCDQWSSR